MTKLCLGKHGCGEDKPIEEFRLRRQNKAGRVYEYRQTYCRDCERRLKQQRYRADPSRVKERVKRWKKANIEKVRRDDREYQSIRRRDRGAKSRGVRASADSQGRRRVQTEVMLDAAPLLEWLERNPPPGGKAWDARHGRALRRARAQGVVELGAADAVLLELGRPDLLAALYPEGA